MSRYYTFWYVLLALIVFNWVHPFSSDRPTTETAYFLAQDDSPAFTLDYSADRATQTVISYKGNWPTPQANTGCVVLSSNTWTCNGGMMWADRGVVGIGRYNQPALNSVSWLRYTADPLIRVAVHAFHH